MSDDDRFDLPERTGGCRVCGWETWDGECDMCDKRRLGVDTSWPMFEERSALRVARDLERGN